MKKNKKSLISIIIIVSLVISVFALSIIREVWPYSPLKGKGTECLEKTASVVLRIEKNKTCIPVSLYLYEDNTYELFTEYEGCRPFQSCITRLHYTKSIKGTYDYDLTKILDNSINRDEMDFDYKKIDYEILMGPNFGGVLIGEKYDHDYVTKVGKTNKYLKEFLEQIDVNLNLCAIPDYNNVTKQKEDLSFDIVTDEREYSPLQSDIKGIPFKINCNNSGVEVEIDGGSIVGDDIPEGNDKMIVKCNTTIYWSPISDNKEEESEYANIKFSNLDHTDFKEYKISKNKNDKYYVVNN